MGCYAVEAMDIFFRRAVGSITETANYYKWYVSLPAGLCYGGAFHIGCFCMPALPEFRGDRLGCDEDITGYDEAADDPGYRQIFYRFFEGKGAANLLRYLHEGVVAWKEQRVVSVCDGVAGGVGHQAVGKRSIVMIGQGCTDDEIAR